MNTVNHSPNRLYNCDETDLTVIQHKGNKLVSLKSKRQVGMLLGEAFNKGATVAVATNAFRKTGLYPCNRHIFSDFEFQEVSPNTHEASDHSSEALPNRLDDANTSQPRPGSSSINGPKTPQN
ncbi:hypothetical protein ANN_00502 [Periplaneta americana]|uniref:Uncharacterized protein n=1 Tax=Periplaneta americana TaxID=6978 RepID=A0ABQ8TSS3_PERAM|nr:hypothetical protein ANN_00502 [Periplaneta americana]